MTADADPSATRPPAAPSSARLAPKSFEAFYRQELPEVLGLLLSLGASWDGAQDAVQDAFLEAQRYWDRIRCYERPGAWVRMIAVQRLRRAWRRQQREPVGLQHADLSPRVEGDTSLEVVAEHADVWAAIRALPERQAQVVVLHYSGDLQVGEIANLLGISSGTVKTHLHNARQALAQRLTDHEEGGER